jgi:zinc protease
MPSTLGTGLAPVRTVLDNGVVVIAKETRTTPAVTINLAGRAGSVCDPPDAPGAMYLLSRVVDRGTATRSADDIAAEFDSRGLALATTVTRHVFSMVCTCLAEDFEPVLALLGDILMSPSIPEAELATRKGEVVTGIRQDDDNPAVRAVEALMALLYPDGHPYGRRLKGTAETVERLTRERLVDLHRRHFGPNDLSVVVVGDVSPGQARDCAERAFGPWTRVAAPENPLARPSPATSRRRLVIPMMNKAQADIAYGFVAIARASPAYEAFRLMNNAFGQYAIGGRLGDSIRERQGMAYYVFSSLDASVVEGPLVIRAGVSPANVDRTIASIDEEIARLVRDGLTERELNESRQYLVGSLPRTLETNAGIAHFLQTIEFFGLGLDYDVRMPDMLAAVTLDDVHAAARILDPDRATIVVAGPYEGNGEMGKWGIG